MAEEIQINDRLSKWTSWVMIQAKLYPELKVCDIIEQEYPTFSILTKKLILAKCEVAIFRQKLAEQRRTI